CLGRRGRRLHRRQHGGRGRERREDPQGSRRARPEARRALLQGLSMAEPAVQEQAIVPAPQARVHQRPSLLERFQNNRNALGWAFMAPTVALLVIFLTYPLGLGTWLGFTDAKI